MLDSQSFKKKKKRLIKTNKGIAVFIVGSSVQYAGITLLYWLPIGNI